MLPTACRPITFPLQVHSEISLRSPLSKCNALNAMQQGALSVHPVGRPNHHFCQMIAAKVLLRHSSQLHHMFYVITYPGCFLVAQHA